MSFTIHERVQGICALACVSALALPLFGSDFGSHPSSGPATPQGDGLQAVQAPSNPRLVVLGIDGMDPELLAEAIERYPDLTHNLAWLVGKSGGIRSLGTSNPPQSPVAWNNFITGRDPGGHGVFDFLHRDPVTRGVKGSTTKPGPGSFFGLLPGEEISNRSGRPFWQVLADKGIPADIWRMPCNFPVEATDGVSFSDMFTPAIDSAYGEATLFTTDPFARGNIRSEKVVDDLIDLGGVIRTNMLGPNKKNGQRAKAPLTIYIDDAQQGAVLDTGTQQLPLQVGEWSDFASFSFKMDLLTSISGVARFYLRSLEPRFELYASPINIDPRAPVTPVANPTIASTELADAIGTYYTQGMAEDVNALKEGILTPEEFLAQCTLVYRERRRMMDYSLDRFLAKPDGGLLFFYFSSVDLGSHMLWRFADQQHPNHAAEYDGRSTSALTGREGSRWEDVIMDLYLRIDPVVGKLKQRMEQSGAPWDLILLSDHGFAPYHREFSLNTWLLENGYLVLKDGQQKEQSARQVPFAEQRYLDSARVDWSRTRAYGMGFNGLYLNLKGRELDDPHTADMDESGLVTAAEATALLSQLQAELEAYVDPDTGLHPVRKAYIARETYRGQERIDEAPDILVGYDVGYGNSDAAAVGRIPMNIVQDNLGGTFNGHHLMDPEVVAGTLLSTLPIGLSDPDLCDVTAEVLAYYGIAPIEGMLGRPFEAPAVDR